MKYEDMIKQIESFKYSGNLKYDLYKDNKLTQYIPTQNSIKALKEIFTDVTTDHREKKAARLIYGAYGSGKSTFLTVLASILGKTSSKKGYFELLNKIKIIDGELYNSIITYTKKSLPYLIVPIDGFIENFHHNIYYSLDAVLKEKNISYKLKDPYIEAAKVVSKWGEESNGDLRNMINKNFLNHKIDKDSLIKKLSSFDPIALNIFKKIFYDITYGVNFRPELNNFYENLDIINSSVEKHGYKGIIYIFDEFGKYLEDNIENIKVKTIQDLAEYCDHGQFNNFIILVSHKEILQYVESDRAVEWKKIESRFKPISFYLNDVDAIYLMKHTLKKEERVWNKFREIHSEEFDKLIENADDLSIFQNKNENEIREEIVNGVYPIHPIVSGMLIMLSKKIAQNERTIFTFLASDEEKSLGSFLKEKNLNKFHFVGADIIFDYFADNLLAYRSSIEFQEWINVKNAINKLDKDDPKLVVKIKILKSIGVINIINNFESIKPSRKMLLSIIDEKENMIGDSIREMLKDKILLYIRRYQYYRLFDVSSIDIEALVEKTMETSNNDIQAVELMNNRYVRFPILPDEYNNKFKMTRYYLPLFVLGNELDNIENFMEKNYYDGIIAYIITNKKIEDLIKQMKGERILYVYKPNTKKILYEIKKLIAIEYLLSNEKDLKDKDPKSLLELREYKNEITSYIENYIIEWFNPEDEKNIFIQDGIIKNNIKSTKSLSKHMSKELSKCFNKAMVINNELINKRKLSNPMAKARREIIDGLLLSDNIEPFLGYKELSTNYTFIRSLLERNGILSDGEICIPDTNESNIRLQNANYVMTEINEFIKKSEKEEMGFYEIINRLKSKPYGLRNGYLPVLLAAALRKYRKCAYIRFKGKDQQLSGELFESINRNPNYYTIIIDHWPKDKENYISDLELEFNNYINWHNRARNRLNALYDGILSHYKGLTKYSRSTVKNVSESTINYRKMVEKGTEDYRDFFFNEITSLGSDYNKVVRTIFKIKKELETALDFLVAELASQVKNNFELKEKNPIYPQIMQLLNTKWEKRIVGDLEYFTNRFVDLFKENEEFIDDKVLIEQMAALSTGFEISYWGDKQHEEFNSFLKNVFNDLEKTTLENKLEKGSLRIIIENDIGIQRKVSFSKDTLSENGQILKNIIQANIDNFGQALNHKTKKQIICEVLMKYI